MIYEYVYIIIGLLTFLGCCIALKPLEHGYLSFSDVLLLSYTFVCSVLVWPLLLLGFPLVIIADNNSKPLIVWKKAKYKVGDVVRNNASFEYYRITDIGRTTKCTFVYELNNKKSSDSVNEYRLARDYTRAPHGDLTGALYED